VSAATGDANDAHHNVGVAVLHTAATVAAAIVSLQGPLSYPKELAELVLCQLLLLLHPTLTKQEYSVLR
jgi:hypothetical protein